jgi:hypothetical protein
MNCAVCDELAYLTRRERSRDGHGRVGDPAGKSVILASNTSGNGGND